ARAEPTTLGGHGGSSAGDDRGAVARRGARTRVQPAVSRLGRPHEPRDPRAVARWLSCDSDGRPAPLPAAVRPAHGAPPGLRVPVARRIPPRRRPARDVRSLDAAGTRACLLALAA